MVQGTMPGIRSWIRTSWPRSLSAFTDFLEEQGHCHWKGRNSFLGGVFQEKDYSVAAAEYLDSCQYLGYSGIQEQSYLESEKVEPVMALA
jgi:hypothetical protein